MFWVIDSTLSRSVQTFLCSTATVWTLCCCRCWLQKRGKEGRTCFILWEKGGEGGGRNVSCCVKMQECGRYNRLTDRIRSSLDNLIKVRANCSLFCFLNCMELYSILLQALQGLVVMSSSLELVGTSLFLGKVPTLWQEVYSLTYSWWCNHEKKMRYLCRFDHCKQVSYPSLKPLASYIDNLLERLSFLHGRFGFPFL